MSVSLPKGANVSLSKQAPDLKHIVIGLGWDVRATEGSDLDLDASLFMLKEDGRVRSDADFVFYNNKTSPDGAVEHLGDDLTGEGAADDAQRIKVDLDRVPSEVAKLSVAVTIHEAEPRKQNFGMVSNAYIRVVDGANGGEIARYELSEDALTETAMIMGEVYRRGGEWKFRAVGQGYAGGLGPLARNYGVDVSTQENAPPPPEPPSPPPSPPEPVRREQTSKGRRPMGLFGSREEIRDVPTEAVVIPENVARVMPDAGEYFLWWLGANGAPLDEVAAHVDALRGENGWISLDKAGQFGIANWRNGPLTFLTMMTAFDDGVTLPIWASHGLKGADKRTVKENVESVARGQGHAAAAAWAIAARSGSDHNLASVLEPFAGSLVNGWEKQLELYYPRHVRKAFKKWSR